MSRRYPLRPVTKYTPLFRNISVSDVVIEECGYFISAKGLPEQPLMNVSLSGFSVNAAKCIFLQDVDGFRIMDTKLNVADESTAMLGCYNVSLDGLVINGRVRP